MQAVIKACQDGYLKALPCVIISNNSDSEALAKARREGIPGYYRSTRTHPDPEQLDIEILQLLQRHKTDLVILAGYMRKLGSMTLAQYKGRVLNIHPALLPKYGGQGMYGRYVHEAVLAAKEKETGVTIHLVDEEYDQGTIIAQARMPVLDTDTADTLAQRVLETEHRFLVQTLKRVISEEFDLVT
jgi:phosphoribosylglycinamide formyltransferase 1